MVVFGQKLLCLGKIGCIRARWLYSVNVVLFDQKLLYSGKMVVLGQSGCVRAKVDVIEQGGNIPAKWLN